MCINSKCLHLNPCCPVNWYNFSSGPAEMVHLEQQTSPCQRSASRESDDSGEATPVQVCCRIANYPRTLRVNELCWWNVLHFNKWLYIKSFRWSDGASEWHGCLCVFFPFWMQSRAACTPPRRKPLESDFETIKLISNGAYGWATLFCLTQWKFYVYTSYTRSECCWEAF